MYVAVYKFSTLEAPPILSQYRRSPLVIICTVTPHVVRLHAHVFSSSVRHVSLAPLKVLGLNKKNTFY